LQVLCNATLSSFFHNSENIARTASKLYQNDVWDVLNNILKIHPHKYKGCGTIEKEIFTKKSMSPCYLNSENIAQRTLKLYLHVRSLMYTSFSTASFFLQCKMRKTARISRLHQNPRARRKQSHSRSYFAELTEHGNLLGRLESDEVSWKTTVR